jgi:tRNA(Arg) A34 adenosine deaminase TadA
MVVSTEPCALCLGAIPWSGIRRLVCGARDEDARSIGFDEGEKVPYWIGAFGKTEHFRRTKCLPPCRARSPSGIL